MEGPARTSIFHSLNKGQQPPTRHRANLSPPGHKKSQNKKAAERAPGASRNCSKHGHLSSVAFPSKLPPDGCPPSLPHSLLRRGLSPAAEHKRSGCEAAREAASLQESAVAWGRGSTLRPAVPSATAAFPLRVPVGHQLRIGVKLLTVPLRPALGNSARAPIFQQPRSSGLSTLLFVVPRPRIPSRYAQSALALHP